MNKLYIVVSRINGKHLKSFRSYEEAHNYCKDEKRNNKCMCIITLEMNVCSVINISCCSY